MHWNEPHESHCQAMDRNHSQISVNHQGSMPTLCLGLGIAFCLIGLAMACNPADVETMQSFRESFHKMIGEPSSSYSFAQAAVVFYTVPGAIMIAIAFRKPTLTRSISSLFGALMLSIVLAKALFGRLDVFVLVQLLLGIGLVYYAYGVSMCARWQIPPNPTEKS